MAEQSVTPPLRNIIRYTVCLSVDVPKDREEMHTLPSSNRECWSNVTLAEELPL